MPHRLRSFLSLFLAASGCLSLLLFHRTGLFEAPASRVLADEEGQKWYRGNIHTHSLWSDGDDYPEMIALWYREHGYDFLCFTDHNVLPRIERWSGVLKNKGGQVAYDKLKARFPDGWINERTVEDRLEVRLKTFDEIAGRLAVPDEFLLIQGEEITDKFKNLPVHMNATNLRELIPPHGGESVYEVMQNNTNAVIAQRERTGQAILVHLNHPNFGYGVTAEDLMRVRGENFFEVYNGHPSVHNKGNAEHLSTERMWDIILTRRLTDLDLPLMHGLATDDGHEYHKIPSRASEPGRGWVMVLAKSLTPEALINALERGEFYASSGVFLNRVISNVTGLSVEVKPETDVAYTIDFIGTRTLPDAKAGRQDSEKPDADGVKDSDSGDIGTILKTADGIKASYQFTGDELYVRARITSSKRHPNPSEPGDFERAWVQPLRGPAARPNSEK